MQLAERALAAGKAVLQEKPIAQTAADAFEAVVRHRAHAGTAVWAIAENYRYFLRLTSKSPCYGCVVYTSTMSVHAVARSRHKAICSL